MILTIGSQALKAWRFPLGRKPRDWDIVGTQEDLVQYLAALKQKGKIVASYPESDTKWIAKLKGGDIIEWDIAHPGNIHDELLSWVELDSTQYLTKSSMLVGDMRFAAPGLVLSLKLSHRYLKNTPHFLKTMSDIHEIRSMGFTCLYPPTLIKSREAGTYTYLHPSLEKDKQGFFSGDQVPYKYEHDDIHYAVARIRRTPAFLEFQSDGAQVKVSREKFQSMSHERQIDSVVEESYVLALERMLVPNDFNCPPKRAFLMALEKVCTSITSGWWREFAWEHYYAAVGKYDPGYVKKFGVALELGEIRLYQGVAPEMEVA